MEVISGSILRELHVLRDITGVMRSVGMEELVPRMAVLGDQGFPGDTSLEEGSPFFFAEEGGACLADGVVG